MDGELFNFLAKTEYIKLIVLKCFTGRLFPRAKLTFAILVLYELKTAFTEISISNFYWKAFDSNRPTAGQGFKARLGKHLLHGYVAKFR